MFHYSNGEKVEPGDIIQSWFGNHWVRGVVKMVIEPGTQESIYYSCPQGGVLTEEDWNGKPNLVLQTPENRVLDEDYELIQRAKN